MQKQTVKHRNRFKQVSQEMLIIIDRYKICNIYKIHSIDKNTHPIIQNTLNINMSILYQYIFPHICPFIGMRKSIKGQSLLKNILMVGICTV